MDTIIENLGCAFILDEIGLTEESRIVSDAYLSQIEIYVESRGFAIDLD